MTAPTLSLISSTAPISDKHQAAREWAARGRPVFPCCPGSKRPWTAHGFHDASCDPAVIDRWWAEEPELNPAWCPESAGLAVVDLDGPDAFAAWQELQISHGFAPETLTVETPRGGLHLYFSGSTPPTQSLLGVHVDTRGRGSYALLPPSVVDGKTYRVSDDREPAPLPGWVNAVIDSRRADKRKATHDRLDEPGNVDRLRVFLRQKVAAGDVAVEFEAGNKATYVTACAGLELGLTPETVLRLMADEWNPHCRPEWSGEELETIVSNAARYAQNEAGAWATATGEEAFGETIDRLGLRSQRLNSAAEDPTRLSAPVSWSTVRGWPEEPVPELVPGLIERGIPTLLCGPGGSGKSRLGLQLGLAIHAGLPVFGRAVERAEFVYVSYEDPPGEVSRRVHALARRLDLAEEDGGQYWDCSGRSLPMLVIQDSGEIEPGPLWDALAERLTATAGHKLVLVDSCYNAFQFRGRSKIDEGAVMAVFGRLQHFCVATDSTLVILWHPSQAGMERGDASGFSVAWHNAPRARLSLSPIKDRKDAFELKVEKRNHGPKGSPITLHWDRGALLPRVDGEVDPYGAKVLEACVKVALAAAGQDTPIQRQRRLDKWMLDEIEQEIGYRPTDRQVKEVLARGVRLDRLRYLNGTNRRTAGYYPYELDKAIELSRDAKHRSRDGGSDA